MNPSWPVVKIKSPKNSGLCRSRPHDICVPGVEHCSSNAEAMGLTPSQDWIFFSFFWGGEGLYFHCCLLSVHNCNDESHIHSLIHSSNIWDSYIDNRTLYNVAQLLIHSKHLLLSGWVKSAGKFDRISLQRLLNIFGLTHIFSRPFGQAKMFSDIIQLLTVSNICTLWNQLEASTLCLKYV